MHEAWQGISRAAADRSSGSGRVVRAAAEAFLRLAEDLAGGPPEDVHLHATEAVRILLDGQPTMAGCVRLTDAIIRALDTPLASHERLGGAAQSFASALDREEEGLVRALRTSLPRTGTLVTVSASASLIGGLTRLHRNRLRVLCAASEPGGEGHAAAEELAAAGLEAEVVPDAAVAGLAREAGSVVFGADAVGPGGILNKTGTLAAVLGAREGRVLCLGVAGTSMFVDAVGWSAALRGSDRRLLPTGERVPLRALDAVPTRLLSAIVTDEGALSPTEARRRASAARLHPLLRQLLDEVP